MDSVKNGIWKNDIFIKKIVPSPYKVILSTNVTRYNIHRNIDGNRVLFSFIQNGCPNSSISNIFFSQSSGTSMNLGTKYGFENVVFPFNCRVTYATLNSFKTITINASFEIEITETGDWEIILNN